MKLKTVLLFICGFFLIACSTSYKKFSYTKGGDIWFRPSEIKLRISPDMQIAIFYKNGKVPLNVVIKDKQPNFIVVDGKQVSGFQVDYDRLTIEDINTVFGKGHQLTLTGKDVNQQIEQTLVIACYANYPDAALFSASYKNTGSSVVTVNRVVSNNFRLDASRFNPQNQPYDFWSFQGAAIDWGLDYEIPIRDGFKQENWMGVQPKSKAGGGVPFIDLWNENAGFAIAHIDPKPQLVSFPVEVTTDKTVEIAMSHNVNKRLSPGERFQTLQSVVIAHALDYYDPLKTYSSLMAAQGIKQKKPSDEAHEAVWCGWGYLTDFTLEDIYGTLPKLKELGIKWIDLDDRWWDKYGDWNVRAYTFPRGERQMKQFIASLHKLGFKVKIWWAPTPVQPEVIPTWGGSVDPGMAQIAKDHPEWLIMDENGDFPRDCRDMYQFCPSVPAVQEYMKQLTTRFIRDWDFDGHKLDAYYIVPPCYNPAHNHQSPEESGQDLPKLLKIIYETSKALKPSSVTQLCNCGTTQDFYQSVFTDQPVTSDPISVLQSRRRVKSMKALWGANAPIFTDHVEHIRPDVDKNDKSNSARVGQDFATSMGTGGVIGTKFTWPAGPENMQLTGEREQHWIKWVNLYHQKMLSKGDYLNLYDIIYDKPETHVVQKGKTFYYAFYAKEWQGEIELRGLEKKKYKVYDYDREVDLGTVTGPTGKINPTFKAHLLIECTPLE